MTNFGFSFFVFLNMIFSEWILYRVLYVVLFLTADMVFNCGVTSCKSFHLESNNKSFQNEGSNEFSYNIFNAYINSVINETKALEEVIYYDIINNIRSLITKENNTNLQIKSRESTLQSNNERTRKKQNSKSDSENLKKQGNKTYNVPLSSCKSNVFLSGANEFLNKEESDYVAGDFTPINLKQLEKREYLLGYSGSPFGSSKEIPKVLELVRENQERELADPRKKRSVVHLYNMVLCATGCNPFSYKGYGCYCGFLGSGFIVDGIDSCCKMHDWCYNSAGCPMFLEYFIPYLWKCYHGQPLCAIDHGYYGGPGSCAQRLCECDRQLAMCLRRFPCPTTKALCTSSPWRLLQNILML